MTSCKASLDRSLFGLRTLTMENDRVRTSILLDRGANIYEFVLKSRDRDLLFHHPRMKPTRPILGVQSGIDNFWFGGIDEIFPTNFASSYKADDYPIVGELWARDYECKILKQEADEVVAYLLTDTVIASFTLEKWITVKANEPKLEIKTKLTNRGYVDFDFIWGYHATFPVNTHTWIGLPASQAIVEDFPASRFEPGLRYDWPKAKTKTGEVVDMSTVPPPSATMHEFHYGLLNDGWLAVTDSKQKIGVGASFPKEILKYVFLWVNYGYWRGCYNVGVYPVTAYPAALDRAVREGRTPTLKGGESLECEVSFVGFTDIDRVKRIDSEGNVE